MSKTFCVLYIRTSVVFGMIVLHDLGFEWFLPFLVTKLIKANMGPKKQQRLTKWEQDEILQSFYAKFEIETDKTVVLRQLIGDNEDVDFNRAESHLSKDEEKKSVRPTMMQMKTFQLLTILTTPTNNPQRRRFYHPMTLFQIYHINVNSAV